MKPDKEFVKELGPRLSRMHWACLPANIRKFVREVQADALEFAGQMMTANAADTQKAFEEIHNARVRLMEGKR